MTYQLIVKGLVAQEIMTKIISMKKRDNFIRKLSMFDSLKGDNTVEITFDVDSLSVDVNELEKKLSEAVVSTKSNVISWKKLD